MQQPLRLGIDLRDLKTALSGQKTYLEELLLALEALCGSDVQLVRFDTVLPVYTGNNRWLKLAEHAKLHLWKQVGLVLKAWLHRVDVLVTTDYFVPYFSPGFKTITVFHDAFFFENPEHYSPLFLKFFHKIAVPSAKQCDRIIVPSDHVRVKLQQLLGTPAGKLVTIYEAPKSLGRKKSTPAGQQQYLRKWDLSDYPYILHVGMLNRRKNIPLLIRAFKKVWENNPELKLVLAGSRNVTPHINDDANILKALKETGIGPHVVFTGYTSDEDLSVLYANARLYVFPSINEGFGLPVLEAFMHGLPVLVANNSCLPEIGGDGVVAFDPFNADDLAVKINTLLSDPEAYQRLQQAGRQRLTHFSWQKAATQLVDLCRSIS